MAERKPSGRGRAALAIDWWPASLPEQTSITPHTLITHDGEVTRGLLYGPKRKTDTVFCLMHPRQEMHRHPLIPGLVAVGHSVWAQSGRDVGNDIRLVHESALLDVAAGMEKLQELGFEHIVLVGISGGAGLYAFYTEQAQAAPANRVERTPAGAPTGLAEAPMPPPSALALVAPHPGQGRLLLNMVDASVADESDPLSLVTELDPYDPENGFGEAPEGSHYAAAFVERYRVAQRERVERLDARARELIAERVDARRRWKGGSGDVADERASVSTPILATYRTDADPRCTDLGLDPSDRPYGSLISPRPSLSNYGPIGFGRVTTPDAWLSTWSGLSSNASLARALPGVTVPTLLVEYTGDCSVFPADVAESLSALAAEDATHLRVRSDHFGRALAPGEESGNAATLAALLEWSETRLSG
jgi:hypothetical protein